MNTRRANDLRREAYLSGSIPSIEDAFLKTGEIPLGMRFPHEVELAAMERALAGCASMYDLITLELLANKCFEAGCALVEDISTCPGFCRLAVNVFSEWVVS